MNNDISIRPAYLDQIGPEDAFAEIHGFVRPPRISMKDDRFNVLDEDGAPMLPPSLQLQVIMLQENDTRIYRDKNADGSSTYDPDNPLPPDCYSDNRVTPSEGALQQQHPICAGCPRAVRDQPSQDGKTLVSACKDQYKIACLVAGAKGKVFLLTVGPKSRRPYANYFNFLKQHHAKANQVITTLGYADKAFSFSFEGWINPSTAEMVKDIYLTDEPAMVVSAFDRQRQAALPAPKAQEWSDKITVTTPEARASLAAIEASPVGQALMGRPGAVVEPPKRRGRPPKEAPQAEASGQGPVVSAANPTPPQPVPAPKNNGFGMETAQAPPQNILDALNRAGIGKAEAKVQADVNTAFGR